MGDILCQEKVTRTRNIAKNSEYKQSKHTCEEKEVKEKSAKNTEY